MNLSTSLHQRCFVFPRANFATDTHKEIIELILEKHGDKNYNSIKLIDENDEYDSFLVETDINSFCIKISFDEVAIFYDYMAIVGINHLTIAPIGIDRGQIEFGKTIYYSIQTFEYSNNLKEYGVSSIYSELSDSFNLALDTLHSYKIPSYARDYVDDVVSYLNYNRLVFEKTTEYVDDSEKNNYSIIKDIYNSIYDDMLDIVNKNLESISAETLVHGNLDQSTIIVNSGNFKFINFENCFMGSHYFDIASICYEMSSSGMNEYDFVSKRIYNLGLIENRFAAKKELLKYKTCKIVWLHKKLLDIIKEYFKESIILNSERKDKLSYIANEFSKHFYSFDQIKVFVQYKDFFIQRFTAILNS